MRLFASLLRTAYKLSDAKKAFFLPEDEILKVIEKQNRSRPSGPFFTFLAAGW